MNPTTPLFLAWARTVPRLVGNPLYHWTHLELQRYIRHHEALSEKTAPRIWRSVATLRSVSPNSCPLLLMP